VQVRERKGRRACQLSGAVCAYMQVVSHAQPVSPGWHITASPGRQHTLPAAQLFVQMTAVVPLHTHIPGGLHELHAVLGWYTSVLQPPHAFSPALGLLHVVAFMPEQM
jgi:hypothetical protein